MMINKQKKHPKPKRPAVISYGFLIWLNSFPHKQHLTRSSIKKGFETSVQNKEIVSGLFLGELSGRDHPR